MSIALTVAAGLLILLGLVHSILGEKYIIKRLLRRDNIPKLFGTDLWTKRIIRFAWHLTTVAWFGFAVLLLALADHGGSATAPLVADSVTLVDRIRWILTATFGVSAVTSGFAGKGRHPAWVVFALAAVLTWVGV